MHPRTTKHQEIHGNLAFSIGTHIRNNKLAIALPVPLDVHFDKQNVVQPDFQYISESRKNMIKDWMYGSPDFIIEVTSATTLKTDTLTKLKLYGNYDVIEYWIIKPNEQIVKVYHNHNHHMQLPQ